MLIGQTWSAFSDPEAEPDGLDFEGLNAISLFRQPGIRWTKPLNDWTEFAIALENPAPDITGASGVNQIPDLIARVRFNPGEDPSGRRILFGGGGHTQLALLMRQIRGEATIARTRSYRRPALASTSAAASRRRGAGRTM